MRTLAMAGLLILAAAGFVALSVLVLAGVPAGFQ